MKQAATRVLRGRQSHSDSTPHLRVCMHVVGPVRTDQRVLREATALADVGLSVIIVDVERDLSHPTQETIKGIAVRHISMRSWFVPTRFKPWFLVKLATVLMLGIRQLLRTPADIYHAQDIGALPACYVAARIRRKPLIFDAHELPFVGPAFTRWQLLTALAEHILQRLMARCSGVITVSPPIATELHQRYGGPLASVIRNMPAYQTPIASNQLREYLRLDPETRIALYQGYLLEDRRLDSLVRSAKFLAPGHVIVMMGEGPIRSRLEALILDEGVADRVKLVPHVPYQELLSWTSSADIGLIIFHPDWSANIQFCLPNKLFEYLMAGVPVLASPLDAVADILSTYGVGRVVPTLEFETIGHAISEMLGDSDELTRMHNNALVASQQSLCWERESQRLVTLYQDILGDTGLTQETSARSSQTTA